MEDIYWAAKDGKEFAAAAFEKVDRFYNRLQPSDIFYRMKRLHHANYGYARGATSFDINEAGETGEISTIHIPLIRFLTQSLLSTVISNNQTYEGWAQNTDSETMQAALLATDIFSALTNNKNLPRILARAAERAVTGNEGWVHTYWDHHAGGEQTAVSVDIAESDPAVGEAISDSGKGTVVSPDKEDIVIFKGDLQYDIHPLHEVVRELSDSIFDSEWRIVRKKISKYTLAAQYPDYADEILNESLKTNTNRSLSLIPFTDEDVSDKVFVWTLYHLRTPALPEGKKAVLLNESVVLSEGPMPLDVIPVDPMTPSEMIETCFGYTPTNDLLAMMDGINAAYSAALTAAVDSGNRVITSPKGNGIDFTELASGRAVAEFNISPPTLMEFPGPSGEVFALADRLEQKSIMAIGQNEASIGQIPASSRMPAEVVSTLEQKVLQYNSALTETYNALWERVGNTSLYVLKKYASNDRIVELAGETNASRIDDFKNSGIGVLGKVRIKASSPLLNTPNARMNVVEKLLPYGMFEDKNEVAAYLLDGNVKKPLETEATLAHRIRKEMDELKKGKDVEAFLTDDHVVFMRHAAQDVLNLPPGSLSPQAIEVTKNYIMRHLDLALRTPPVLAAALNHTPIPMAQPGVPPQAPMPENGAPPPTAPNGAQQTERK